MNTEKDGLELQMGHHWTEKYASGLREQHVIRKISQNIP